MQINTLSFDPDFKALRMQGAIENSNNDQIQSKLVATGMPCRVVPIPQTREICQPVVILQPMKLVRKGCNNKDKPNKIPISELFKLLEMDDTVIFDYLPQAKRFQMASKQDTDGNYQTAGVNLKPERLTHQNINSSDSDYKMLHTPKAISSLMPTPSLSLSNQGQHYPQYQKPSKLAEMREFELGGKIKTLGMRRGLQFANQVLDNQSEKFLVMKRSIFRSFKRYICQHIIYITSGQHTVEKTLTAEETRAQQDGASSTGHRDLKSGCSPESDAKINLSTQQQSLPFAQNNTTEQKQSSQIDGDQATRIYIEPAMQVAPELTQKLFSKLRNDFNDLLKAVKEVHVVDKKSKPSFPGVTRKGMSPAESQIELFTRIMADLCYKYNKFSKENLLRNNFISFSFICFAIRKLQAQSEVEKELGEPATEQPIFQPIGSTASQLDACMTKFQKEKAVIQEILKLVSVIQEIQQDDQSNSNRINSFFSPQIQINQHLWKTVEDNETNQQLGKLCWVLAENTLNEYFEPDCVTEN